MEDDKNSSIFLGKCENVNSFERLNRIGEGTYGTVYRGRDKVRKSNLGDNELQANANNSNHMSIIEDWKDCSVKKDYLS